MKSPDVDEQIRALARDLQPVRPIPRIRVLLAGALLLALAPALLDGLSRGQGLRPASEAVAGFPYLGLLVGLVVTALGGLGAALSSAIPGREPSGRIGIRIGAVGAGLVLAAGLVGLAIEGGGGFRLDECLRCTFHSCLLALGPVVVTTGFLRMGVLAPGLRSAAAASAMALIGSVAAGSALVHLICSKDAPIHWLLGHAVFAAGIAIAFAAPVAGLLHWRAGRASDGIR